MTKFERWILNKIIREQVRQGGHEERIAHLYQLIHNACKREFYEDNAPTLNSFLAEQFEKSLQVPAQPNMRYREIAHQATEWCEQNAKGTPVAWEWEDKFAELIVKECALTAGLMERDGREGIGAQILDNFGIKQ